MEIDTNKLLEITAFLDNLVSPMNNEFEVIASDNYVDIFKEEDGINCIPDPIAMAKLIELRVKGKTEHEARYCQTCLHLSDRELAKFLNYLEDNWYRKLSLGFLLEGTRYRLKGVIESFPTMELSGGQDDSENLIFILVHDLY